MFYLFALLNVILSALNFSLYSDTGNTFVLGSGCVTGVLAIVCLSIALNDSTKND